MAARRLLLLTAIIAAACGGDSSAPNPPPSVPVALVTVTPGNADLVPAQTHQLTAVLMDGSGHPLSGRTVTWSSSATSVATVTASGLVTAVAAGTATITAASENKSGVASLTVAQGGYVGSTGGTVVSSDQKVRLQLPAGAVPGGTALTITPSTATPAPPAGSRAVPGATYAFGPDGTHFGTPVTVTLQYDPAVLPRWVVPGDLVLQRWDGTQWSRLTEITVDPVAHTVSGKTPGFSNIGVYFLNPQVTLTPTPALVNGIQRSVTLTATVSGTGRLPDVFDYLWMTTGSNGALTAKSGNTAQYTALSPILPAGDLDGVKVLVLGQWGNQPPEVLGYVGTAIRSDLDLVVQLQPTSSVVQYGASTQFTTQIFDRKNGNQPYQNTQDLLFEWDATITSGMITPGPGQRTASPNVSYTANPASQQSNVRPKGDKITVTVIQVSYELVDPNDPNSAKRQIQTNLTTAQAFVTVIPNYQVALVPQQVSLSAGGTTPFQLQVTPAWQEPEQLFYQWRTTGSQGTLSVAQGAPLTQNSVTYTASQNPSGGTDFVDVDVFVGTTGKLGSARASVSVDARSTTVQGAYFVSPVIPADPGRSCVWAYVQFPLVAGGKSYEMYARGFNDPAFWQTQIQKTFTVPLALLPAFIGASGVNGGSYYFFLTGGCGPNANIGQGITDMNARFAGMVVDVVVRF